MRVLQVFEPPDGGVAEHVARLTEGLLERGHEVEVAGPAAARIRSSLPRAADYHVLPFTRSYRRPARDLAALRDLRRILQSRKIDLVHAHSSKAGVVGRLAARSARVPCVYTPHCFPFIGEVSARRRIFGSAVERALGCITARTICVSRDERGQALQRRVGAPERLEVIYNGVDPCRPSDPDPELRRFAGDHTLVGAVAVHRRQKGLDRLLDAVPEVLARRPDVRFAIVGEGPLLSYHRERAEQLGIGSSVTFTPFAPPPGPYLLALDVFVLPSRWEAFSIAVLESMACGTPVVANAVGGTAEALADGAGVLIANGDQRSLIDEIARLVESPEERAAIAAKALTRVSTEFGSELMVDRTAALYAEVVGLAGRIPASVQP